MPIRKILEQLKDKSCRLRQWRPKHNPLTGERLKNVWRFLKENRRSVMIVVPTLLLIYYIVGGRATHEIDKNTDLQYKKTTNGLAVVDASAALIKREVDDHMWTANLPIIFPGYVLDNMPHFQMGIIRSLKVTTQSLLKQDSQSEELQTAEKLLSYPPNIWLLSKKENLSLAPSSGAQYRKARNALLQYNRHFEKRDMPKQNILLSVLRGLNKDNRRMESRLEAQVREHSSDWVDLEADNVFYEIQGRLYGYKIVLNALAEDFTDDIVSANAYPSLTSLLKTIDDALSFEPFVIRNGEIDALLTPNHLTTLNYYVVKIQSQMNELISQLTEKE